MKPIEIRYENLSYILRCAKIQLEEWLKELGDKEDQIYLNKVENILTEITATEAMNFIIDEMPF